MKRRSVGLLLILLLVVGCLYDSGSMSFAKKLKTVKHSVSLFKGETIPVSVNKGTIKTVKVGNSKIVKSSKVGAKIINLKAKKVGSTTVTVKTSKEIHKYSVKVVKVGISVSQDSLYVAKSYMGTQYNSTITFKIVNNSSTHIGSATIGYTLYDKSKKVLEKGSFVVNCMVPKGAAYYSVDYALKESAIASSETKVVSWNRDPNYIYTDQSSKIDVKSVDGGSYEITNKGEEDTAGIVDIMFKDSSGIIFYMETASFYLKPGDSSTYKLSYVPTDAVKTVIVSRAVSSKSKKI